MPASAANSQHITSSSFCSLERLAAEVISLLLALVGCGVAPDSADIGAGLSYRYEGAVSTTVTLLETPQSVVGRAELVVPAGTSVHAYSEIEFSNGEHEAFFRLEELSTAIPDLTGPTTHSLELGPLPLGSRPCYEIEFAVSGADKGPELLELSGCVRDVSK